MKWNNLVCMVLKNKMFHPFGIEKSNIELLLMDGNNY